MNPIFIAGVQAVRHSILRTISVICVIAVICGLWFAIDRAFIHPKATESYAQHANKITNIEYNYIYSKPKTLLFLGVELFGFKFGVYKDRIETEKISVPVKQEVKK